MSMNGAGRHLYRGNWVISMTGWIEGEAMGGNGSGDIRRIILSVMLMVTDLWTPASHSICELLCMKKSVIHFLGNL